METYKAVMAQIQKLQQKAEQLRLAEIKGVVKRIREAMSHYGLTAEDLTLTSKSVGGKSSATKSAKKLAKTAATQATKPGAPKYRDPASGKTWTGRGKPPAWIAGAASREAFLIAANESAAVASAAARPAAKGRGRAKAIKAPSLKTAPTAKKSAKRAAASPATTEPMAA